MTQPERCTEALRLMRAAYRVILDGGQEGPLRERFIEIGKLMTALATDAKAAMGPEADGFDSPPLSLADLDAAQKHYDSFPPGQGSIQDYIAEQEARRAASLPS